MTSAPIVLFAGIALLSVAQPPQADVPAATTELVEVDVMVMDRHGQPVTGLTAEDFLLLEDGKPQEPAIFLAGEASKAAGAERTPTLAAAAEQGLRPSEGRHIVFAVDDWHLSEQSLALAKVALKRVVAEQLSDQDDVAVVTTSGALGLVQPFTRERAILRRAIDRLGYRERRADAGGRASMSEYQAEAIERGDAQALELAIGEIEQREELPAPDGVRNPRLENEVRAMARSLLSQSLGVTRATRETLQDVLVGLESVPGRKLVVLVSDGFLLGTGTAQGGIADLRPLMDAATRSRAAVFALHSRGLVALPPGGDASQAASLGPAQLGLQQRYEREAERALREGMRDLAESTGGLLVQGTNDVAGAMASILDSHAAAYLLAYRPAPDARIGRFHRIEVKLPRRSELTVRARRGYFSQGTSAARAQPTVARREVASGSGRALQIRLALASLVPLEDVPLKMAADFLQTATEGPVVVIRARADAKGVGFRSLGARREADLEFVSAVYAEDGRVVAEAEGQRMEVRLELDGYERVLRDGLRYQRSVSLAPGLYQVRVAVRDEGTAQLGSAWRWVDVPDIGRRSLALSDVVLYAEASDNTDAPTPTETPARPRLSDVQALRRYARGANLYYVAYAYSARRDDPGGTDVVTQAQVWANDQLQGASPVQTVALEHEAGPASVGGRIALEGLGPGDYELRVFVVDRKTQATIQKRVAFTIE